MSDRWLVDDPRGSWRVATVIGKEPDAEGAAVLRLRFEQPADLLPGQCYLLRMALPDGTGVVQREYSVSSSPWPPSPEVELLVRDVAGTDSGGHASALLVHEVEVGDQIQVRGPFGFLTWTQHDGGPLVLVGAGSGVAPLLAVVRYAAQRRAGVPMTMLCSSRNAARVLAREPLERLAREGWLSVVHTFTRSPGDHRARYHRRIDAAMLDELSQEPPVAGGGEIHYLVAGPADMVSAVRRALASLGVPDARVDSEDHS